MLAGVQKNKSKYKKMIHLPYEFARVAKAIEIPFENLGDDKLEAGKLRVET